MKVQILQKNKRVSGSVGDVVECEPSLGNALAGTGVVKIIEHDPVIASQPKAVVVKDEQGLRAKQEREGGE